MPGAQPPPAVTSGSPPVAPSAQRVPGKPRPLGNPGSAITVHAFDFTLKPESRAHCRVDSVGCVCPGSRSCIPRASPVHWD